LNGAEQVRLHSATECSLTQAVLFSLTIAHKIFSITEQLGTVLQSSTITFFDAQESAKNVVLTLKTMKSEMNFMAVRQDVTQLANNLEITPPQLPRKKHPRRRNAQNR